MYGQRIRALRERKRLSQRALAAELRRQGLRASDVLVSGWEHEAREPGIGHLCALARLFEVSTDYLLGLSAASQDVSVLAKANRVSEKTALYRTVRVMAESGELQDYLLGVVQTNLEVLARGGMEPGVRKKAQRLLKRLEPGTPKPSPSDA